MISVTSQQLSAWLAMFAWPFARILALLSTEPIVGNRSVPARVKIGLAFLITLVVAPALSVPPVPDPGSPAGLLILAQQILVGISMGLAMRVVFSAVEMAGHLAGLQMGLGFALFFDPQSSGQVPVVAQFLGLLALLLFLAMNGHLILIAALIESFEVLPIISQPYSALAWKTLAGWGGEIFRVGLLMALPVVAALLVTNVAIGIVTRAAPQLNIFVVGFPLTLGIGFLVLALALPYLLPLFEQLQHDVFTLMIQMLEQARP
ncbi:MAG: flagellar biosynthetic protein FliR [Burkholderiales bacterium]